MGCISKLLLLKGEKEFLPVPNGIKRPTIAIEDGGNYKNYEFIITLRDLGFRCGYVSIPPWHTLYNSKEKYPIMFDIHGGITFFADNHLSKAFSKEKICNDKWIGFDAGHGYDLPDVKSTMQYFPHLDKIKKNYLVEIFNIINGDGINGMEIRTKDYMINECKKLIDQLIEMENVE